MSERRKYKRVDVNVAIKGKIVDLQRKVDITGDIPMKAMNLSEGGALLEWPRSWNCNVCSNCLGWVHNRDCRIKEGSGLDGEFNKELVPEMHLTLQIIPGNGMEPVNALAKVNWVRSSADDVSGGYQIGISFAENEKQDPDIKKKILVIKKNFEAN